MIKKTVSYAAAVTSVLIFSTAFGSMPAKAQQASNFQNSCQNIRYGTDSKGTPVIQASCRKMDGRTMVDSAVAIRGFENLDGRIAGGPGVSSFQKSCRNMKVEVRGGHVWLNASCRKMSGEYVDASAIIYDVSNIDGNLRHRVPGNDTIVMASEPARQCSPSGAMFPIEFVNETRGPVTFHWMDFDCKEGGGPKLAVGGRDRGSVGQGHIFRIRDASGKLIGSVTASSTNPRLIAR